MAVATLADSGYEPLTVVGAIKQQVLSVLENDDVRA
jgi:hypothetical protein